MSDELSNATRIAALEEQVRRLTLQAEMLQINLNSSIDSIISACTGSGCVNTHELRVALDRERERCGVLEREVRAARKWERQLWIDLEGVAKPQPPFLTGPMRELTEARAETDTRHALDAAKFGKEQA